MILKACVEIDGKCLEVLVHWRVLLQGSTLGLLLLYVDDLVSIFQNSCAQLYADDTVIYTRNGTFALTAEKDTLERAVLSRGGREFNRRSPPLEQTSSGPRSPQRDSSMFELPRSLLLTSCVHSDVSPSPAPPLPGSWRRELIVPPLQHLLTAEPAVPPLSPC